MGQDVFLFKCGIILKKKQSSTGKPAKLGIISIIPLDLISSNYKNETVEYRKVVD